MSATTSSSGPSAPTADEIVAICRYAMAAFPAAPIFASSVLFPRENALAFHDGEQEYRCAGPSFWRLVEAQCGEFVALPPNLLSASPRPMWGIEIVNIDAPGQHATRVKVFEALSKALRRG